MSVATSGIFGERESGSDVRQANLTAVMHLANILRSSLGPQGLDKLLVDDIGDVVVTNDGATILRQLEIVHPAAKMLVELSSLQDSEVGDGTTSVVLLAAELLKRGQELVRNSLHPTAVISGYKLAMKEAVKFIQDYSAVKTDALGKDMILNVAKTVIGSKYIGAEESHFAQLIVDAVMSVKMVTERGASRYPVKAVNVLKCHGKSTRESFYVNGYGLRLGRASQGMPSVIQNAKIALVDFNLQKYRAPLGVQVQVDSPAELEKIRQQEQDITKKRIQTILKSGANVVMTTKGIDDMCMKYFVEAKILAVRRVELKDLRRIAKATGGKVALTLATLDGGEAFESQWLGSAKEVTDERVGDNDFVFIRGCQNAKATTVVLRGANEFMLDEVERSVHDALCAVSKTLESSRIVPGGGAVETALTIYLEDFARTLGTREQLAVAEFAEALQIIPKQLAMNAALDATELLARLRAIHAAGQQKGAASTIAELTGHTAGATTTSTPGTATSSPATSCAAQEGRYFGLDLINGTIRHSLQAGVVEPLMTKTKAIKFAAEASCTLLRIDDLIKTIPEPEPQMRR